MLSNCDKGTHVATGYKRIVYGDHGPYFEFDESQIIFKNFKWFKKKSSLAFYDERYTENRHVKLYEQKKSVNRVPNPPRGAFSKRNNRPEGYADYLPGMYYISAFPLTTDKTMETATTAATMQRKTRRDR